MTSSQKPERTSGKESTNASREKKVCATSSQPGLVSARAIRPPMTMIEEMTAIA